MSFLPSLNRTYSADVIPLAKPDWDKDGISEQQIF